MLGIVKLFLNLYILIFWCIKCLNLLFFDDRLELPLLNVEDVRLDVFIRLAVCELFPIFDLNIGIFLKLKIFTFLWVFKGVERSILILGGE